MADGVQIEGVRELIRALRQAEAHDVVKEMGQSNKSIGQLIIDRLQPLPKTVGRGAGARVRPSATSRLVQLRAGGKHRVLDSDGDKHTDLGDVHLESWGRIWVRRGQRRPHIVGTALRSMPDIESRYMDGIGRAMSFLGRR